jgi:hypothetical protein
MASQRTVSSLRACLRTTCRIWAHGRPAPHLLRSPRAPVRRSLCLVCLLTMLAAPEVEQSTIPEPQPSGSARITGRVLASGNGPPVRRARVRLSGSAAETRTAGLKPAYVQREVETDDNGAFDFAGLPGGSYYISVREERISPASHSISRARRSSTTCWSSSRPRRPSPR